MSLAHERKSEQHLPASGTFVGSIPEGDNGKGGYLFRVAYADKGTPVLGSLTTEKIIALRNQSVDPEKADVKKGTNLTTTPSRSFNIIGDEAHIGFKNIDLSGIKRIDFLVQAQPRIGAAGGVIEIHLDSATGKLIGKTEPIIPKAVNFRAAMAQPVSATQQRSTQRQPPAPLDMAARRRLLLTLASATIESSEDLHDVYFVFRNTDAKPEQILVQVSEIAFHNELATN
jgi:cytochrome c